MKYLLPFLKLLMVSGLLFVLGCMGTAKEVVSTQPESPLVPANQSQQITYADFIDLWLDATTAPGAEVIVDIDFNRVVSKADHSQYYFASVLHPAYPAVMRRSIVMQDGQLFIITNGWFVNETPEFIAFEKAFTEHTAVLIEKIKQNLASTPTQE